MTHSPLIGEVTMTAYFGEKGPYWPKATGHTGYDLVCANKNVYAACDGTVTAVTYDKSGGWYISIKPDFDASLRYTFWHLLEGSIRVKKGARVDPHTIIGTMGNSGSGSHGTHLHFEIRKILLGIVKAISPALYIGIVNKCGVYKTYLAEVPPLPKKVEKGCKVQILPTAKFYYGSLLPIPSKVKLGKYTVDGISLDGKRARLQPINSFVAIKDLKVVD